MDESLIYVGMAGRSLTESMIAARREGQPTARLGLASHLGSHAGGRRSGDQFCVYVADRLVLPALAAWQVEAIGTGGLSMDALVRSFVRRDSATGSSRPRAARRPIGSSASFRLANWLASESRYSSHGRRSPTRPITSHSIEKPVEPSS